MNGIEIIAYNLDVIGAVITLILTLFLILACIVRKEKTGIWVLGILTLILVVLLCLVLSIPLVFSPSYLFGLISTMIFIVGLMKLSNIIGLLSLENKGKE